MPATLYGIPGCPHTVVAELLLERAGKPYRRINLPHGLHRFLVRRVLGFDGDTVPALVLSGRRLQQTRAIASVLGLGGDEHEEWAELELRRLKKRLVRHRLSGHGPPGLDAALDRIDALAEASPSAELHCAVLVRLIECFDRVRPRPALELADRLCPRERYPGRLAVVL